jgi:glutathione synthase/RimK-type ligase-like ATP-grasp enzyme
MKSTLIKIGAHQHATSDAIPQVYVCRKLAQTLSLPLSKSVWLCLGSDKRQIQLQVSERKQILALPTQLLASFGLIPGVTIRLAYDQAEETLRLGPFVALFVQSAWRSASPFGEMTPFARELLIAARREGVFLVVTTPANLKPQTARMVAFVHHKRWHKIAMPFPDVIYNRLQTRKIENSKKVQKLLQTIKSNFSTAIFNEQFLDKISVFRALEKEASIKPYLPKSISSSQSTGLRQMMSNYPLLFIKPATGSMGRGIIRVNRNSDGSYITSTTLANGARRQTFRSSPAITNYLEKKMKGNVHLIQQGLHLLHVRRQNLDYRALVQKDRRGKWTVTSIVARIAAPRHFVSNLARGGTLTSVIRSLRLAKVSKANAQKLQQELRKVALLVADALDRQMKGQFGELGVDLAIDHNHRIWLLEVNSKPSKTDPQQPGAKKIRPSARKAIQYARYLAKF